MTTSDEKGQSAGGTGARSDNRSLDLDHLQEVADGASPLPWSEEEHSNAIVTPSLGFAADGVRPQAVAEEVYMAADREFITAARSAVPDLIAEVRQLRELLVTADEYAAQMNVLLAERAAEMLETDALRATVAAVRDVVDLADGAADGITDDEASADYRAGARDAEADILHRIRRALSQDGSDVEPAEVVDDAARVKTPTPRAYVLSTDEIRAAAEDDLYALRPGVFDAWLADHDDELLSRVRPSREDVYAAALAASGDEITDSRHQREKWLTVADAVLKLLDGHTEEDVQAAARQGPSTSGETLAPDVHAAATSMPEPESLWLNAFQCISPSPEFLAKVGAEVLRLAGVPGRKTIQVSIS